jgi:hypothetical protein
VFEFVRNGGLREELHSQPSPSESEQQLEKPVVQVLIPRPELDLDANAVSPRSEADFPRVPTGEPIMMTEGAASISILRALVQLKSPQEQRIALPESAEAIAAPMDAPIEQLLTEPILPSTPEAQPTHVKPASQVPSPKSPAPKSPATVAFSAVFIADNSVEDGHGFPVGAEFVKSWRLRNNGTVAWPESTVVTFIGGDRCGTFKWSPTEYHVGSVAAGAFADVTVEDMKAPGGGRYVSYWRLRDNTTNQVFGDQLWCEYVPSSVSLNPTHLLLSSINVEESSASSMSSSSVVMMPQAAPADERGPVLRAEDEADVVRVPPVEAYSELPPPSPSTLRSSSPTEWSTTSGSSVWEDTHPHVSLHRAPSTEFVFVEDDDVN